LKIKPTRRRQPLNAADNAGKNQTSKKQTDATPSAFAFMVTSRLFT
jgi:hypothetical protein